MIHIFSNPGIRCLLVYIQTVGKNWKRIANVLNESPEQLGWLISENGPHAPLCVDLHTISGGMWQHHQ
jgi:hypothetical protein